MNFDFAPDDQTLFAAVRTAAAGQATPEALAAALAPTGYLALAIGRECSGPTLMGAMEALAGVHPGGYLGLEMSTRVLGRALARWGRPDQRERWLAPLARGAWIGALALAEQGLNVDNDPLAVAARPDRGGVCLDGDKSYVVNAPAAAWIGVVGRLEERPALFMVPRAAEGLAVAEPLASLAAEGLAVADVRLTGVQLPEDHVVALPEDALDVLRLWENQVLCAAALGLQAAALSEARDYAKTHRTGGKPIIAYQEVGFKLAEMLTLLQTSQLYAYRAAWTADASPREARSLTWCAKVFCSEAAERVAGDALRILGGAGFRPGCVAAGCQRWAKYPQVAGTSTEIARVKIGDDILGYLK
jgi:alkylation response protein AidB-like acyl-CoA dehydrogenase